jgi:hypothetical protein
MGVKLGPTVMEELVLWVFWEWYWGKCLEWRRKKWQEVGEDYTRNFINYTLDEILLGWLNEGGRIGYVAHMGEMRNAYRILSEKPEGKSSYGRLKCSWEPR